MRTTNHTWRLTFCTCDYCGQGTHTVRFDGGGYCSHACASSAELAKRRAGREVRMRQEVARSRQTDQLGALRVGIGLIGLLVLIVLLGCDSPQDHVGPDELNHVRAGRAVVEVAN